MLFFLTIFCIGLSLLLFSTHHFVRAAERISQLLRISPLIVGVTVVAIGTSLPELAVSLAAIIRHDTGLALGNIIGSNIINVLLVFAIGVCMGGVKVGTTKTQRTALLSVIVVGVFIWLSYLNVPPPLFGILLLLMTLVFSLIEYRSAIFGRDHEDKKQFSKRPLQPISVSFFVSMCVLIIGMLCGGYLLVWALQQIAQVSGISTTVLGLTVSAVATSLPELLTTIRSQKDHQAKITVGNILGSNIYNLTFICGIIALFPLLDVVSLREWWWLLFTSIVLVCVLLFYKGRVIHRRVGWVLLLCFLLYIFSLRG